MESSITPAKPQVEPHNFYPGCCPVREEDTVPSSPQPTSYALPDLPQQFVMESNNAVSNVSRRKQSRPRMVQSHPIPTNNRDKPFNCRECDYQCRTKGNLVVHMRVHTGERPYRCLVCNKTFTQSSSCRTHMVIHYPNKPFKCDYPECRFECNYKGNLVAHKRKHTGEKPYKCDECGKCFSQYAGLYSHRKLHTAHIQDFKDTLHWINYLETISTVNPNINNNQQLPQAPPLLPQAPPLLPQAPPLVQHLPVPPAPQSVQQ